MVKRVILHIDMNAYFATVAQLSNPKLAGKPVAVGGFTSRSIITTASYEARKFGVKSAMPVYLAKKLCPQLIITSPDFSLYEKYTAAFIEIIRKYAKIIELASIDECYVDISEEIADKRPQIKYIKQIQNDIYSSLGLKCSIGVAPNKFLAKMASDMKKPMGVTILSKRNIAEKMYPLPINNMYGIGKKSSIMLNDLGIFTIGDFVNYDNPMLLEKKMGKYYGVLYNWAIGEDTSPVLTEQSDVKSIGNSHTLLHDTNDYAELKRNIEYLANKVALRAEEENMLGFKVTLTIKYHDFKVISRSTTLKEPINDYENILINALNILDINYIDTKLVRLLGVSLGDVKKKDQIYHKFSIFDEMKNTSNNRLINRVIDDINKKMGTVIVKTMSDLK